MSIVPLTTRQQKLRKMHTAVVRGLDGNLVVELVVGCQSFTVFGAPMDAPEYEARRMRSVMRDHLARALSRVGRVEKGKP